MSDGLREAILDAIALGWDEHALGFSACTDAVMAVIEEHTERITVSALGVPRPYPSVPDAVIVVEGVDEVLMNRYQHGVACQAVELTMLRGSGSWEGNQT